MLFILVCLALTLLVIAAICLPLLSGMSALPARGQYRPRGLSRSTAGGGARYRPRRAEP